MKIFLKFVCLMFAYPLVAYADQEVNVYSYRQPHLIEPLMQIFTNKTGIKVNTVYTKKGMVERLLAEGENSPADLALTTDISRAVVLKKMDLLQPVESALLQNNIPERLRDPEHQWFSLTQRARVIFAARDRVPEGSIVRYEQLADPDLGYTICTRRGNHPYNISLIASMVMALGKDGAKDWLRGVSKNLGRKPQGNDKGQIIAVYSGECDLAISNTYYYAKMVTGDNGKNLKEADWAKGVYAIFPNQDGRGAHVNISSVALLRHAPNRMNAIRLMEWLSGEEAQYLYAHENHEFPVKLGVKSSPLVVEHLQGGKFKADPVALSEIANKAKVASRLVAEVRFGRDIFR